MKAERALLSLFISSQKHSRTSSFFFYITGFVISIKWLLSVHDIKHISIPQFLHICSQSSEDWATFVTLTSNNIWVKGKVIKDSAMRIKLKMKHQNRLHLCNAAVIWAKYQPLHVNMLTNGNANILMFNGSFQSISTLHMYSKLDVSNHWEQILGCHMFSLYLCSWDSFW